MRRWIGLVGLVLVARGALAAGAPVMPVEVVATGDDSVGQQLSYFVKQDLSSSSTLSLTDANTLRIRLALITLDASQQKLGYETVYSAVWTWVNPKQPFPLFLDQSVGYCGLSRVQECAQTIVANTQSEADQMIRLILAGAKSK